MKGKIATIAALEDNMEDLRILKTVCENFVTPIQLLHFETAAPFLQWIATSKRRLIDIAILDVRTYGEGGLKVLGKMRSLKQWRCVPAIVVSTSNSPLEIRRSYEMGANTFIVKPLDTRSQIDAYEQILHYWLTLAELDSLQFANNPLSMEE